MDKQAMLMELMGAGPTATGNPAPVALDFGGSKSPLEGVDFSDPSDPIVGMLIQRYQLSPEEVQQLQMTPPGQGQSIADRLRALRPNVGGFELGIDGEQVTARTQF